MPRKKTTEPIETPNLEMLVMQCPYQVRDASLAELRAGIVRVLQPRSTTSLGGIPHFLAVPQPPMARRGRGGKSDEVDPKEQQRFQQELLAVSQRERELNGLAQQANGVANALQTWLIDLGIQGDRLLLSTLTEQDRPEVESFVRAHARLIRTANAWTDKLKF